MSSANSRILLFTNSYLPVIGGVQTVAHNLAKELIASGHQVRVVTNRFPVKLPAIENIDGVSVERLLLLQPQLDQLRWKRPDLFLASLYFGPRNSQRIKRIFQEFKPDVVNVHFPDHQVMPILKLRGRFPFRLVVSFHGHDIERFIDNPESNGARERELQNLRTILQSADALTAVSPDLMRKVEQVEPTVVPKIRVINNGVDPARFTQKDRYEHSKPYVLAVGRLTYNKGFDLLIDAYARHCSRNRPDLILAGDGEEREALEKQVDRLGLSGNVHFFGHASPNEIVKLMNGCLSVAMPSRSESFGVVALEAVAAGKPLLATTTGGLQEFLREIENDARIRHSTSGEGQPTILFAEPTVEGIAKRIAEIFDKPSRDRGTRDYRLPEKYTWTHIARSYERVLLGGTPAA